MSAHEGRSQTRARRGVFVGTLAAHLKCFLLLFTINQGQRHWGEALPACLHTHDHIRNRVTHLWWAHTHTGISSAWVYSDFKAGGNVLKQLWSAVTACNYTHTHEPVRAQCHAARRLCTHYSSFHWFELKCEETLRLSVSEWSCGDDFR